MATRLYLGVNLGFARYVWSPAAALDIVHDRLGLCIAEPVAENDFGPSLYLTNRSAFSDRHRAIRDRALARGMSLPTTFTFYRDAGAVCHPHPAIRRSAEVVLESLAVQAAECGSRFACAALMTADRDSFATDPVLSRGRALAAWKRWSQFAHSLGLEGLLVEMSAQAREECHTIESTRLILEELRAWHNENQDAAVPFGLCYDLGHAPARSESGFENERDYRNWFQAFPDEICEIHLKNTDPDFLATWPFTAEYTTRGIIHPPAVIASIRDYLSREVYLNLEIAGKRGRELGEQVILNDLQTSVEVWKRALLDGGFTPQADGAWTSEPC